MEESSLIAAPSILDGDNYETWAVKMTVHLQALDVWEAMEENYEVPPLGPNPTVAQMKLHKERKTRKAKAKACLFAAVSPSIFIKIMKINSAAEIWEYLKEEYKGNERIKNMQVMNLIREFEMKKMRESDAVKDYAAQFLSIANKVRLLGKEFSNEKIVQKILVTLLEKYEAAVSSLENSKDLSTISLTKLLHSLEVVEQRRLMRQGDTVEGAFQARMQKNLVEKEFKVYFEDKNCIIKDVEGKEVFNIKMKRKSFALNLLEDEHTAILRQDSTTMFWDRKVEHFHHDDVLYMKKNQIAEGLPDLEKDLPICATCQYGKQTKLPFPKKISWRATQKLQLVHTDVGGSQKMPSLKWNANNVHQLTAPYNPQQNGVVERKNRTILKMTRCLLHEKDLPKKFWAETASRAVYFLNILLTKALKKQTPFEVWFEFLRARLGVCIYEVKEEC
ncbi:hypothetical protein CK203_042428 [Vitis vinifera]|uniref:Integrase catalytic domain-containing protein n=1 Tax=Vitis vinifera TaxID=29760 RepID=A0A438HEW0_VITVI|nr:hypothetical protein CK203_042428 [Vitis vinifera]